MDAVEFLKVAERRMKSNQDYYGEFINLHDNDWVALVAQVEQWAKEHPAKTRQSEFLKMFPNAYIAPGDDTICISPCNLDLSLQDRDECKEYNCAECRKNYWLQEVE